MWVVSACDGSNESTVSNETSVSDEASISNETSASDEVPAGSHLLGFIKINTRPSWRVSIGARFSQTQGTFDSESLAAIIEHRFPPAGTCFFRSDLRGDEYLSDWARPWDTISAGDPLELNSPDGRQFILSWVQTHGDYYYLEASMNDEVPLPTEFELDIPGGEFPQMLDIIMPVMPPEDLNFHPPDSAQADTVYRWTSGLGGSTDATVHLRFRIDRGDESLDTAHCVFPDTGEARIPDDVIARLAAAGHLPDMDADINFNTFRLHLGSYNVIRNGDSTLVVESVLRNELE
jgi:hypothetical protein